MRYTLLLHYPEPTAEELGPEALEAGMRAFQAYAKALDEAGVLISAEVLQRSDATTTVTPASRRVHRPGRAVRRQQGTARRHVRDRRVRPRRGARVGQAGTVGRLGPRGGQADGDPLRRRRMAGHAARQLTGRLPRGRRARRAGVIRPADGDTCRLDTRPRPCRGCTRRCLRAALCEPGRRRGVPENPQGWLVTVARNRIRDVLRSAAAAPPRPLEDDRGRHAERARS